MPLDAIGAKPVLESRSLALMVERRLRTVPVLNAAIEQDSSFALQVGLPAPHGRDSHGRSWDIVAFQTGFLHWPQGHIEFRTIVDELRAAYDLA